ncbi:MAG: phosphate-starvation-inducible E [Halieaceae bacterium]|nr:phosphate-starvation-inducible E [Halieaceae bacterium]|tara:strand:+ start:2802 stop:3248 length:447 start_codon:yes stop_codon:yes gene_type:complete
MSKQNLGDKYPAATQKLDNGVLGFFSAAERILLVIISLLTMLAVALELAHFAESGRIRLADLLLLFIYLEVIGMAYAYYATHSVPVTLPVLIAITGITRLIILQGKEAEPSKLLFEAGAVLLLAVALAILSWASQRFPSINSSESAKH